MMNIPRHIAIIMDGNGRWAAEHGLSRAEGHFRGAASIEKIVEAAKECGVKYLTLYAFSEENWSRPGEEVVALMGLLKHFLQDKREAMRKKGVHFEVIGDIARLPADVVKEIEATREATKECRAITLVVALSYGSRQEICMALENLMKKGVKEITPEAVSRELYTRDIPDPDLLIRTSGECRMSNFLLWQSAYTEFYFTKTRWPDFDEAELRRALESYSKRERRFGMTSEQLKTVTSDE